MYLKSLTISSMGRVIREVVFRKGVNLIVDETQSTDDRTTGNNVGKTTVLMLVDFCLGGSGKSIYIDPENRKQEYKLVKDFLLDKQVLVTLVLQSALDDPESREVRIERNFLAQKNRIRRVNGIDTTEESFEKALTDHLIADHYPKKPTFRQIISHNIRYKSLALTNTIKTLDAYTRDDEYETLYLFLLGCQNEAGDTKQELRAQIRLEEQFKKRLEREQTLSGYEAALAILENELKTLEERKSRFNLNERFVTDLDALNQIRYQINAISSDLSNLELRRRLILEAREDLQSGTSNVDGHQLQMIYQQAKAYVVGLQKSFVELQAFHNTMIAKKVEFITKDLPKLSADILNKGAQLERLLEEERSLSQVMAKGDSFEELEKVIAALNESYRKKGEFEVTIAQLREVESNLKRYSRELDTIDDELFSEEAEKRIKEQVDKFNRRFAAISQELYGEQYALKVDKKTEKGGRRIYVFSVFHTNMSSGKKQGEISCFDIAYTLFADAESIPCMHFLLNDKKELMHDNQLIKLAALANQQGIQFVASILKDKLPAELDREDYVVLKLSQTDKLFRIEGWDSASAASGGRPEG